MDGLQVGDWVAVVDDVATLRNEAAPLLQVVSIDPHERLVQLSDDVPGGLGREAERHPLLRRWDHQQGDTRRGAPKLRPDGSLELREDVVFELEDGVQITFQSPPEGKEAHIYQAGDYWLIPSRRTTGDVIWP